MPHPEFRATKPLILHWHVELVTNTKSKSNQGTQVNQNLIAILEYQHEYVMESTMLASNL